MKVAILAGPLDNQTAGIHIYTKELIRALAANPQRQHEYILIREQEKSDFPEFENIVIPVYPIPGFASLRLFFLVPLICWWHGVDIVFEPAHFGPFNLPKCIKRVTFIHDLTPILFPHFHTFNGAYLQKWFLPGILKRTDLIITNSEHTKADVEKVYPFTKGKVVRNYLGYADIFRPVKKESVLQKYHIKRPFFLNVGTIEPRKNLTTLLSAYADFKKQTAASHQLIIVGKRGWKCEAFFEQLEQHPYREDIKILGYVDFLELPVLYTASERFIYPSIYEGFGLPIVEARACRAHCIVANNSSLTEVGGAQTDYFSNEEELSQLLVASINQNKKDDPRTGLDLFSWKKHGRAFEQMLAKLVTVKK